MQITLFASQSNTKFYGHLTITPTCGYQKHAFIKCLCMYYHYKGKKRPKQQCICAQNEVYEDMVGRNCSGGTRLSDSNSNSKSPELEHKKPLG